jgi:hypothetical protein
MDTDGVVGWVDSPNSQVPFSKIPSYQALSHHFSFLIDLHKARAIHPSPSI